MEYRHISIAGIEIGPRLRAIDPAWVALLAEEIGANGLAVPIRVVARGKGFVLIDGARRVAALAKLGCDTVAARIEPEAALADAAFIRLGEIRGGLMRSGLTVLDRAYYVAAWREVYESVHTLKKRGRRPNAEKIVRLRNNFRDAGGAAVTEAFAERFSEAARQALNLSKDSIYRALKIATIEPALGRRLAGHPCADNQSELLRLADEPVERQAGIVDLLTWKKAATVAQAIDILDGRAGTAPLSPPERLFQSFSRLSPAEQEAFFEEHAEAIEDWLARGEPKPRGADAPALHIVR